MPDATRATRVLPFFPIAQPRRIRFKHTPYFIAHLTETLQNFLLVAGGFRGIQKRPVMTVHLTGKNRAGLVQIATNGDDGVNRLFQKFLQVFRAVAGNVNARLGHDLDGERMNMAGWV